MAVSDKWNAKTQARWDKMPIIKQKPGETAQEKAERYLNRSSWEEVRDAIKTGVRPNEWMVDAPGILKLHGWTNVEFTLGLTAEHRKSRS